MVRLIDRSEIGGDFAAIRVALAVDQKCPPGLVTKAQVETAMESVKSELSDTRQSMLGYWAFYVFDDLVKHGMAVKEDSEG